MKVGGIDLVDAIPDVDGVAESSIEDKFDLSQDLERLELRTRVTTVEKLEHSLIEERSMLTQRKIYAFALLGLSVVWLYFIGKFMWHFGEVTVAPKVAGGSEIKPVSDAVIIALITTTTINVLGLFYIVARWLFPQKISNDKSAPIAA